MAMVPMRELTLSFVRTSPLISPVRAPSPSPASTPRATLWVLLITSMVITPTNATRLPMERSTSPVIRSMVIPIAAMMSMELSRRTFRMFVELKNLGLPMEMSTQISARIPTRMTSLKRMILLPKLRLPVDDAVPAMPLRLRYGSPPSREGGERLSISSVQFLSTWRTRSRGESC